MLVHYSYGPRWTNKQSPAKGAQLEISGRDKTRLVGAREKKKIKKERKATPVADSFREHGSDEVAIATRTPTLGQTRRYLS